MAGEMKVIDPDGKWWINTGAFRMVDPDRDNFFFETGVKYKIRGTAWMQGQPTMQLTDDNDQEVYEKVLKPEPMTSKPVDEIKK